MAKKKHSKMSAFLKQCFIFSGVILIYLGFQSLLNVSLFSRA